MITDITERTSDPVGDLDKLLTERTRLEADLLGGMLTPGEILDAQNQLGVLNGQIDVLTRQVG